MSSRVDLIWLAELQQRAGASSKAAFVEEYPGVFLVAMGLLSAELLTGKRNGTVPLSFARWPRHDLKQSHPLAGKAFLLRSSVEPISVVLGRGGDCGLVIPEPSISEAHCQLQVGTRGVEVIDLNSTNGTAINLRRLSAGQPALLGDEDILTLGRYSFQVVSSATCHAALRLLEAMTKLGS